MLGADHPSGVNQRSSTEMVSFPAQRDEVTHSPTASSTCLWKHLKPPHTPVPEAHGPRRVSRKAVHDTPHSPQHAVLSFPTLTELNLLCVHNRTRMRNVIGTKIPEEPCCLKSETNQLIQSGTLFLQLFKNIKKHTSC